LAPVISTTGSSGRTSCTGYGKLSTGKTDITFCEHEVEAPRIGLKRRQRRSAIVEPDRLIAERGQHLLGQHDERPLIVDDRDGLAVTPGGGGHCRRILGSSSRLDERKGAGVWQRASTYAFLFLKKLFRR
jgi:hypothetical protein